MIETAEYPIRNKNEKTDSAVNVNSNADILSYFKV